MKNIFLKKSWCFAVILILTTISTMPVAMSISENSFYQKSRAITEESGDNLLAEADISWWFWPLPPLVNFTDNPSGKDFVYPQDNEGYIKLNFTINWRHKLLTRTIFKLRFTHFEFSIYEGKFPDINMIYDKDYKEWQKEGFEDCDDTGWEEFTIYIDQNNESDPGWKYDKIFTDDSTKNLTVKFTITGFPPFYCLIPNLIIWKWEVTVSPNNELK